MHTWCKSWKCEMSLPCRCYGRLYQSKLMVGAPQRLLLLHSMELQFLHQGRKIYSWTSAPLNIMYIIFFTKVANAPFPFRGRYSVELHQSFLRLQGQANDFKIQYSSILRLFVLPKVTFISYLFYNMLWSFVAYMADCKLIYMISFHICLFHLCSHTTLILSWLSRLTHQFAKDKHYILTLLSRCSTTIQFSH